MIDRSIISQYISIPPEKRIIAISDVHANLPVLKKLLRKIEYKPEQDELFLVGDILEKGAYNLETLSFIMHLSRYSSFHPMMGNCDFVCKNIYYEYRLEFLKEILLQREHSILHEMAHQIHMTINEHSDMHEIAYHLKDAFLEELQFMCNLPHVIETDQYIFGHAAILNEETYGIDMRDIMTHNHFLCNANHFKKFVIVGHLPVSEYNQDVCCFNPIFDEERHIVCIDGGNGVKKEGQLNALIMQHGCFSIAHSDQLKKVEVLESIQPTQNTPFFITWHDRDIQILQEQRYQSYCRHLKTGKELWIPNDFIKKSQDRVHAENYTNLHLSVHKGEYVKIVSTYGVHTLVKKQGVMGWVPTRILKLPKK